MSQIDLMEACLELLSIKRSSAGDLTRRLMGLRILPKDTMSYAEVKAALVMLRADGRVTAAGNGKAVHYYAKKVALK